MNQMAPEVPHGCRCGQPTRDHATVCDTCLDKLTRALGDIPWIDTETELTLIGARGVDYRALGGSRASETALPINLGASQARTHLHATLAKWLTFCVDHDVRNQSPDDMVPPPTIPSMSRYLMWRVDGLSFLYQGPDAVDQITAAVARCIRVIDRPADKWYAGPCDTPDCGSDLYAQSQAGNVVCRACKASYDIGERRAWLLAVAEDRLAGATEVARAVSWLGAAPLNAARVWKWAERGRIIAKGHDGTKPLYRIGDAIDLLAADTTKAG